MFTWSLDEKISQRHVSLWCDRTTHLVLVSYVTSIVKFDISLPNALHAGPARDRCARKPLIVSLTDDKEYPADGSASVTHG